MRLFIALISLCVLALPVQARGKSPLKVYILAGQSNMTGMVSSKTLEHLKMFPDTAREFADLFDQDGWYVRAPDDTFSYDWKANEFTQFPLGLGVGRAFLMGKQPVNVFASAWKNVANPDTASTPKCWQPIGSYGMPVRCPCGRIWCTVRPGPAPVSTTCAPC